MKVQDVMTPNPKTCGAFQSASDAVRLMWDFDIGCVPVIDERWRPIGMITDRDICIAAYMRDTSPSQIRIGDVMSREVFACTATDPIERAEDLMRERQVRRLPVVDGDGKLVGILSINDVILAARRSPLDKAKQKLHSDVDRTLEAICKHRPAPIGMQI